ncbi:MAG: glycosyltransferase [Alphaproteobacteria bacterium]
MLHIDVIIATYNSEKRIAQTLESLQKMDDYLKEFPIKWALHIIDNNSKDQTQKVIKENKGTLPLHLSFCERTGKSAALNSCFSNLTAELIVLTDDDVKVAEDWLEKIWTCAQEQPDFDVFTGNIIGNWEKEIDPKLKSWIPIGSTYALRENNISGPCDPGDVWGPNMIIRKSALDKTNFQFDENLGPTPATLYPMGEETNIAKRLSKAGHKSYFNHRAIIKHLIKKETINDDWVIRRAERLGYGIFANGTEDYNERKMNTISLHNELRLTRLIWTVIYPITFIIPRCKHSFWSKWKYFYYRGLLKSYNEFILKASK